MQRRSRKSLKPTESFYLPRTSDIGDLTVNAEQIEILRNLSVAARPSLLPPPSVPPILPDDSNIKSAELRKQFPGDSKWYGRLDKTFRASFTPRASKKLRSDLPENASISSAPSEDDSSIKVPAGRKPFGKKKLFTASQVFEKALDDTSLVDESTAYNETTRNVSNVTVASRRSSRLTQIASASANSQSPVPSPRESFRRWTSTETGRKSRELKLATEALRKSTVPILESSRADGSDQPTSKDIVTTPTPHRETRSRSLSKRQENSEGRADLTDEASFVVPARPKPFDRKTRSRRSFGAALDTPDSCTEASSSTKKILDESSKRHNETSMSEESSGPPLRKPFAKKAGRSKRRSSLFGRILDMEESSEGSLTDVSLGKKSQQTADADREDSQSSDTEEEPALSKRSRSYSKTPRTDRAAVFADALDAEDEDSAVETTKDGSVASSRKESSSSNKEGSGSDESISPRHKSLLKAPEGEEPSTSHAERSQESEVEAVEVAERVPENSKDDHHGSLSPLSERRTHSARKSRRSSAITLVVGTEQGTMEKEANVSLSTSKRRSHAGKDVHPPDGANPNSSEEESFGVERKKLWANRKRGNNTKRFEDALNESSSGNSTAATENESLSKGEENLSENEESLRNKAAIAPPAMEDLPEAAFVAPVNRDRSRIARLAENLPRVVLHRLLPGVATSTPTSAATVVNLSSPLSSIKAQSKGTPLDFLTDSDSANMSTAQLNQSPAKNTRSQSSGKLQHSEKLDDLNNEEEDDDLPLTSEQNFSRNSKTQQIEHQTRNQHSSRKEAPSPDDSPEGDESLSLTVERNFSQNSRTPPKKTSKSDRVSEKKRQSSRNEEQSTDDSTAESESLPSTVERNFSQNSKTLPKQTSKSDRVSEKKRQSSRKEEQSADDSTGEGESLPSTVERNFSQNSPPIQTSKSDRVSAKKRQSSRKEEQSTDDSTGEGESFPSTVERNFSQNSPPKQTSKSDRVSAKKRQSSRKEEQSTDDSTGEGESLQSTAERNVSQNSKTPLKQTSMTPVSEKQRQSSSKPSAVSGHASSLQEDEVMLAVERSLSKLFGILPGDTSTSIRLSKTKHPSSQSKDRSSGPTFSSVKQASGDAGRTGVVEEEGEGGLRSADVDSSASSGTRSLTKSQSGAASQERLLSLKATKTKSRSIFDDILDASSDSEEEDESQNQSGPANSSPAVNRTLGDDHSSPPKKKNRTKEASTRLSKSLSSQSEEESSGLSASTRKRMGSPERQKLDDTNKTKRLSASVPDEPRELLPESPEAAASGQRLSSLKSTNVESRSKFVDSTESPSYSKEAANSSHQSPSPAKKRTSDDQSSPRKKKSRTDKTSETADRNSIQEKTLVYDLTDGISLNPSGSMKSMSSNSVLQMSGISKRSTSRIILSRRSTTPSKDLQNEDTSERLLQNSPPREREPIVSAAITQTANSEVPKLTKSVIPNRIRKVDIRNFFQKSTPMKDSAPDDLPNVSSLTPIKKLSEFLDTTLTSQDNSTTSSEMQPRNIAPVKPPQGALKAFNLESFLNKLNERLPKKTETAAPLTQPHRAPTRPGRAQKKSPKKFQLVLPDGKVYKTPKLLKPQKFVTDKMYRFIMKRIKDNERLDTRVRAEDFVQRLCDTYKKVVGRKKTKDLVHALLKDMVRLGLVSTYSEFYSFVEDFIPYDFRVKAIPCINSDLAPKPIKGIHEKLEFND